MRTTDFIFIMINLYFLDLIDNNVGYLVHGIYYVLLFVWLVYKLKTIKLEYELKKREVSSFYIVRRGHDSVSDLGLEGNNCERCGKVEGCKKLKDGNGKSAKGNGRPKDENKDVPL